MTDPRRSTGSVLAAPEPTSRPLLSVVVPVYNGGEEIVDNVGVIGRAIADRAAHVRRGVADHRGAETARERPRDDDGDRRVRHECDQPLE